MPDVNDESVNENLTDSNDTENESLVVQENEDSSTEEVENNTDDDRKSLLDEIERWKGFSRTHENSVKNLKSKLEAEEASKQSLQQELELLKRENQVNKVVSEFSLEGKQAKYLEGNTYEELKQSAEELIEVFGSNKQTDQNKRTKSSWQGDRPGSGIKADPKAQAFAKFKSSIQNLKN